MKKLSIIIASVALFLTSCVADRVNVNDPSKAEVTIMASLPEYQSEDVFRAHLPNEQEQSVVNCYLMVFDVDGNRVVSSQLPTGVIDMSSASASSSKKLVISNLSLSSKIEYTFCLIGNVAKNSSYSGVTTDKLLKIKTKTGYDQLKINLLSNTLSRDAAPLLLSGELKTTVIGSDIVIPLHNVDSKIKFTIKNGDNCTFKLKRWRLFNAPRSASLSYKNNNEGLTSADYFFKAFEPNVPEQVVESDGFAFYLLPNVKKSIKTGLNSYKEREKQAKNNTSETYPDAHGGYYVSNGAFEYADPNASFVEIIGDYEDKDYVGKDARYIIHLGYVGNDVNNWDVKRGVSYTYNVTIKGITEVLTEVQEDSEVNSGVEADLIAKPKPEKPFDAHYGYELLTFTPEDLSRLSTNPTYLVNTPFDTYGKTDKDWIKFRFHENGDPIDKIIPWDGSAKNLSIDQFLTQLKEKRKDKEVYVTAYIDEFYYATKPSNYSGNISDWAIDGWREFVNCDDRLFALFLYSDGIKYSRDKGSSLLKADKVFSQRSIRTSYDLTSFPMGQTAFGIEVIEEPYSEFHSIIDEYTNGTYLHADEQTNMTNLHPEMTHTWNGRRNYYETLVGSNGYVKEDIDKVHFWSELTAAKADGLEITTSKLSGNNLKQIAFLGCVALNRDENGNGQLDEEEMKWYLPSNHEYAFLGLTQNSFPDDVKLHPTTSYVSKYKHYVTSTRAREFDNNPLTYWAEQTFCNFDSVLDPVATQRHSNGPAYSFGFHAPYCKWFLYYSYASYDDVTPYRYQTYYRCARRLGTKNFGKISKEDVLDKPFDITSTYDGYQITCYLDDASLRKSKVTKNLPEHTEKDEYARPAKSFEVYYTTIGKDVSRDIIGQVQFAYAEKACQSIGKEWRLPSVGEMHVMLMAMHNDGVNNDKQTMLRGAYGWADFSQDIKNDTSAPFLTNDGWPSHRFNRLEGTNTGHFLYWTSIQNALYNVNRRTVYWTSTKFSSNPVNEPNRYVYGLTRGFMVPTLALVRPFVYEHYDGVSVKADYNYRLGYGFVRCVRDL